MNPLSKVLFLSPHMDDEVLAAGGTFFSCDDLKIMYFNNDHPLVPKNEYNLEAIRVADTVNALPFTTKYPDVNRLGDRSLVDYIIELEEMINFFEPQTIMIPARSRNQDHKVVYDAAMVAIRPHDKNYFIPNVWIYEQHEYMVQEFVPNVYIPIDIDKKIKLFEIYKSQQRAYRKPEHLRALAVLRGSQCNCDYAEAFMSIRSFVG